jgi:hypothetical protein
VGQTCLIEAVDVPLACDKKVDVIVGGAIVFHTVQNGGSNGMSVNMWKGESH